jgi:hypothetical protein
VLATASDNPPIGRYVLQVACTEQGARLQLVDPVGEEIVIDRPGQMLWVSVQRVEGTTLLAYAYRVVTS